MAGKWYVSIGGGEPIGPLATAEVRQLVAEGTLAPDDLVTREGKENWVSAGRVKGLIPKDRKPADERGRPAEPAKRDDPPKTTAAEVGPHETDGGLSPFVPVYLVLGLVAVGCGAWILGDTSRKGEERIARSALDDLLDEDNQPNIESLTDVELVEAHAAIQQALRFRRLGDRRVQGLRVHEALQREKDARGVKTDADDGGPDRDVEPAEDAGARIAARRHPHEGVLSKAELWELVGDAVDAHPADRTLAELQAFSEAVNLEVALRVGGEELGGREFVDLLRFRIGTCFDLGGEWSGLNPTDAASAHFPDSDAMTAWVDSRYEGYAGIVREASNHPEVRAAIERDPHAVVRAVFTDGTGDSIVDELARLRRDGPSRASDLAFVASRRRLRPGVLSDANEMFTPRVTYQVTLGDIADEFSGSSSGRPSTPAPVRPPSRPGSYKITGRIVEPDNRNNGVRNIRVEAYTGALPEAVLGGARTFTDKFGSFTLTIPSSAGSVTVYAGERSTPVKLYNGRLKGDVDLGRIEWR